MERWMEHCETKQVLQFGALTTVYRLLDCEPTRTVWRTAETMAAHLERIGWTPSPVTGARCIDCGRTGGDMVGGVLHAECLEIRRY